MNDQKFRPMRARVARELVSRVSTLNVFMALGLAVSVGVMFLQIMTYPSPQYFAVTRDLRVLPMPAGDRHGLSSGDLREHAKQTSADLRRRASEKFDGAFQQ